ncbi:hypothetical protein H257_11273 [Aphanomyces astaci]|uniref:CBM1 domain-containing protein n=1 Tax=Aphanomyces astaci TaxID=112090 RepID=W4G3U4_APHAT|nr:hypothetical protein H257_11273 [Aphanomyces astaci]ETV73956.1 hypothetical protein H257_11273 [Aphanomyces astaci]|eukprot:XP_009836469.1 hypothetical protein H257_11273 [Aphanomyces astaci]
MFCSALSPVELTHDADGVADLTNYCGTIDGYKALPGDKCDDSPQNNVFAFTHQFQKSSYSSLKALRRCTAAFTSGRRREVGTWGRRVYSNENCARNIPDGGMPINVATCNGSKRLFFLWLAMHTSSWQVYKNCVPLVGGGGVVSPPSPYKPPSAYTPPVVQSSIAPPSPPSAYNPSSSEPTSMTLAPQYRSSNGGSEAQPLQQCGGKRFKGPTPCTEGYMCAFKSEWYSQCIERTSSGGGVVDSWGKCGGQGYTGATTCKSSDQCQVKNAWYSQCVPR